MEGNPLFFLNGRLAQFVFSQMEEDLNILVIGRQAPK
jgi:hypothetical protein